MKAFNKKKKRKHYSKGKYRKSIFDDYYYFRSYPLKLIGTVFKDYDGLIYEAWKINKRKTGVNVIRRMR